VIAGEPSGDLLGGPLVESLLAFGVQVSGIGGQSMKFHGLDSLFDMSELSIGGITEVIPRVFSIKKLISATIADILQKKPNVVVTIDSPEFCFRVAKKIKKKDPSIRLVHYVAPSVWAWRPGRAKKMAPVYDHVLTLFDFEPKYFIPHGLQATFVGHQACINFSTCEKKRNNQILILPGSRPQEIKRLLPIFMKAALNFGENIIIPTLPHLVQLIKEISPNSITETDNETKNRLFQEAKCAIAASGTVTLELALSGCPMVVAYKISPVSFAILKRLVRTRFISLVNIIAEKEVVKELIQGECTPENILKSLQKLDSQKQIAEFKKLKNKLINEGKTPTNIATEVVLSYL
jgi:lipid-A-disaccharide synthase